MFGSDVWKVCIHGKHLFSYKYIGDCHAVNRLPYGINNLFILLTWWGESCPGRFWLDEAHADLGTLGWPLSWASCAHTV